MLTVNVPQGKTVSWKDCTTRSVAYRRGAPDGAAGHDQQGGHQYVHVGSRRSGSVAPPPPSRPT